MDGDTRLELGLAASFGLATLLMVGLWRDGAVGGFVVLVTFGVTIIWALWVGWRPARQEGYRATGHDRHHGQREPEAPEAAA